MLLAASVWAGAVPGRAQNADGIAAVVNTNVITFSDVKKEVRETEETLKASGLAGNDLIERIKEARLEALKALIERQLIIQEFAAKGGFLPDNIIENHIHDIVRDKFGNDRTAFIQTLKALGMTMEQFKSEQRDNMIVQYMRQENVAQEVIVSPFKVEQYYQEHAPEFTHKEQVKLRLIFLRKPLFKEKRKQADGAEIEVDTQKLLAEEIVLKLDAGSDFADLAKAYSEGSNKESGGEWGWVTQDTLRKELAAIAFSLFPGQHSRVIQTDDGYYVIRVEDHKEGRIRPMEEVREEIEKKLVTLERQKTYEEWINRLKAKAYVKMF